MRAATAIVSRDNQFLEEGVGHLPVTVLAGMGEHLSIALAQHLSDGRSSSKLRPRFNDGDDFQ
jgi:hypothetical protein